MSIQETVPELIARLTSEREAAIAEQSRLEGLLRTANDALRERIKAADALDAEWRSAALDDLRLRAEVLSQHERRRDRWCRYAAGHAGTVDNASAWADRMIAEEEKRFKSGGG